MRRERGEPHIRTRPQNSSARPAVVLVPPTQSAEPEVAECRPASVYSTKRYVLFTPVA
jgi:hypothetical protein